VGPHDSNGGGPHWLDRAAPEDSFGLLDETIRRFVWYMCRSWCHHDVQVRYQPSDIALADISSSDGSPSGTIQEQLDATLASHEVIYDRFLPSWIPLTDPSYSALMVLLTRYRLAGTGPADHNGDRPGGMVFAQPGQS
jgi:hypothetical protein